MVDFKKFGEASIKVVMLAQEESRRLGHNFVGREQLLTGMMGAKNHATQLLKAAGLTLESVRAEVKKIIGQGSGFVAVEIPFTPNANRALEEAVDIALQYRAAVEPEHILLAIVNSPPGCASKVLENLGVNASALKEKILAQLSSPSQKKTPPATALYERDFYQWIETTVDHLKHRQFADVDWENLIEELEGLGRAEKRAVRGYLVILLLHLLKWERQPEYRCGSWRVSIKNARRQLLRLLKDNPSLAGDFLLESVPDAYEEAREKASEETTIFLENFPVDCPYTVEQLLDKDWLP